MIGPPTSFTDGEMYPPVMPDNVVAMVRTVMMFWAMYEICLSYCKTAPLLCTVKLWITMLISCCELNVFDMLKWSDCSLMSTDSHIFHHK